MYTFYCYDESCVVMDDEITNTDGRQTDRQTDGQIVSRSESRHMLTFRKQCYKYISCGAKEVNIIILEAETEAQLFFVARQCECGL